MNDPDYIHFGRSFQGTRLEDDCPCVKAACGLVTEPGVSQDCEQHPMSRGKTIRQMHYAGECPANSKEQQ